MSDNSIKAKTAAYLMLAQEIKEKKAAQERLKAELAPYLDSAEENVRGSRVIEFNEPLEVFGTRYKSLQRVRKESKVLNEERAVEWLHQKACDASPDGRPFEDSIWNKPVITVKHIDQDELWDLFVNDHISQEELDALFDTTVSWSFLPTRE